MALTDSSPLTASNLVVDLGTRHDIRAILPTHSDLPPYPNRTLADIQRIILHHTVTPSTFTPQRLAEIFVENLNRPSISYHYCVTSNGEIFQTLALDIASEHAGDHSVNSIGVALIGDFSEEAPPATQLEAIAFLLSDLLKQFNLTIDDIIGNSEVSATESPGATWPSWRPTLLSQVEVYLKIDQKTDLASRQPAPATATLTPALVGSVQIQDMSAILPTNANVLPYPLRPLADIRRFIIHHTATPPTTTPQRIAEYIVNERNLPGMTYHYCITSEGQIFRTQTAETLSTHAGNFSADSLGIALIGNFNETMPSQAQLKAASTLIGQLAVQFSIPVSQETVRGYGELAQTFSPGTTWPQWRGTLIQQAQTSAATTPTTAAFPRERPTPPAQPQVQARPFMYPMTRRETNYFRYKSVFPSGAFQGKPHSGVDFHVELGAPIFAVGDGKVIYNRFDANGYGRYIVLEHTLSSGQKIYSLYAHLQEGGIGSSTGAGSPTNFGIGQVVKQGTTLGLEGMTGLANNIPHLHFEIKKTSELGLYSRITLDNIDQFFYDPYQFLDNPQFQGLIIP